MDTYSPITSLSILSGGDGTDEKTKLYFGIACAVLIIIMIIIIIFKISITNSDSSNDSTYIPIPMTNTEAEKIVTQIASGDINEEYNGKLLEHMTAGTLTQLFAVDAQNKALNGDVDQTATGNYNLFWGQPSRVASTYPNRGQLLPATVLPLVAAQQNGNGKPMPQSAHPAIPKDIQLNYNKTYSQQLEDKANKLINYLDNTEKKDYNTCLQQNCGENCYTNPQACGNGAGGYRLGSGFVEPSTSKPFVSLQGNFYYPDEYNGSYWIAPKPDIMKPLPVVANGLYPLNSSFNTN
jgi:hypothetical protein